MPLATTGAAPRPTRSDVTSDVEGLCGALARLELLEEVCNVWEDAMQTEAARHGELAGNVERLQMELKALRQNGVKGQVHDTQRASDEVPGVIRDVALPDAAAAMKEGFQQEIIPVLERVHGLEVHAYTNTTKLDQQLADIWRMSS